jgi:hypothetical protein
MQDHRKKYRWWFSFCALYPMSFLWQVSMSCYRLLDSPLPSAISWHEKQVTCTTWDHSIHPLACFLDFLDIQIYFLAPSENLHKFRVRSLRTDGSMQPLSHRGEHTINLHRKITKLSSTAIMKWDGWNASRGGCSYFLKLVRTPTGVEELGPLVSQVWLESVRLLDLWFISTLLAILDKHMKAPLPRKAAISEVPSIIYSQTPRRVSWPTRMEVWVQYKIPQHSLFLRRMYLYVHNLFVPTSWQPYERGRKLIDNQGCVQWPCRLPLPVDKTGESSFWQGT